MPLRNFKLSLEAKEFIVVALAQRDKHEAIVDQLSAQLGFNIHKSAVRHYNPRYNAQLDQSLKTLYEHAAREFQQEINRRVDEMIARRQQERQRERKAQIEALRAKTKGAILDEIDAK